MTNNIIGVNSGYLPAASLETGKRNDVKTGGAVVEKTTASAVTSDAEITAISPEVRAAVSKLNDHIQNLQRTLSFSVDESTGQVIIRVYDSETNELIREIPAEESIRIAHSIDMQNSEIFLKGKQA